MTSLQYEVNAVDVDMDECDGLELYDGAEPVSWEEGMWLEMEAQASHEPHHIEVLEMVAADERDEVDGMAELLAETRERSEQVEREILLRETQLHIIARGASWKPPIEGMSEAAYVAQLERELIGLREERRLLSVDLRTLRRAA